MMMMGWWENGDGVGGGAFHRRIMCFLLMLGLSFFTGVESTTTSSLSSLLMQHSNKLCFVNQYPMCNGNRRRSNSFLSSRKFAPFLDNSATTSKRTFQQQQRGSTIMRGNNNPNNNPNNNSNDTTNNQKQQQQVMPTILMYTLVPFLPSITIQSINDHYQQLKQQFNLAAAALPPPPSSSSTTGATTAVAVVKDSIEYITASNLYNESMHSLLILLLSKRVALYFMATLATVYAGWRASLTMGVIERGGDGSWLSGPGMALDYLNREVLKGETSALLNGRSSGDGGAIVDLDSDLKKVEEDEDDKLFAKLVDDSPQSTKVGGTIALILPLVLGGSLALSYSLISFFKDGGGGVDVSSTFSSFIGDEYLSAIQGLLPYLTSIPSMILCVLFVATEFRSVSSSSSTSTNTSSSLMLRAENIAALFYVFGAYIAKVYPTITIGGEWNLDLGPLQNGVNIAFAATVVRALSPFLISYSSTTLDPSSSMSKTSPISIRTMALALIGVTMFDGISVFGTVANAATTTVDAATTATSVMETVATYKADAQLWNPGLLSVVVGHNQNAKITEALGLGDVVFPACLVAWGFFADAISTPINEAVEEEVGEEMPKRQISYTTATIAGYVIGSAATEIVGSFSLLGSGRGLPALIFLIPSMLIAVSAVAASRGELNEVWGSSGAAERNATD